MTDLPGITSTTRTAMADRARARSLARLLICATFTPGAGWISKRVITGPGWAATTFTVTPKSARRASTSRDMASSSSAVYACLDARGRSSMSTGGRGSPSNLGTSVPPPADSMGSGSWALGSTDGALRRLPVCLATAFTRSVTLGVSGSGGLEISIFAARRSRRAANWSLTRVATLRQTRSRRSPIQSITASQLNARDSGSAATKPVSSRSVDPTPPSSLPTSVAMTVPRMPPLPCGSASGLPMAWAAASPQADNSSRMEATARTGQLSDQPTALPAAR